MDYCFLPCRFYASPFNENEAITVVTDEYSHIIDRCHGTLLSTAFSFNIYSCPKENAGSNLLTALRT